MSLFNGIQQTRVALDVDKVERVFELFEGTREVANFDHLAAKRDEGNVVL